MRLKTKPKRGRPLREYKVRGIKGMTPRGFEFYEINEDEILFKREDNIF